MQKLKTFFLYWKYFLPQNKMYVCTYVCREIDCKPRIADDIVMKYTVGYNFRHFIFPKKGTEITPLFSMPTATRSDDNIARLMSISQYREQTVGSLCSAMCCSMFMQIYAVYWLRPPSSAFSLARTSN